ncbi:MAG: hypothetical protein JRM72_01745 [Nitrososphaerota archaeon]|nr:hypothetical protein [Nitrososphaerota archaeon]
MDKVTKRQEGAVRKLSNFIKDWSDVISNLDIPKRPARLNAASKPKEKGNLGCIDSPYESLPSAKPAPSLKETIQDIRALVSIAYKRKALIAPEAIEPFLKALEAPPAAERTALMRLRAQVEKWLTESENASKRLNGFSRLSVEKTKKRIAQEAGAQAAYKDVITKIDAQESEDK